MKNNEVVRIAIAETSVIIRGGLTAALKRLSNVKVQPIELLSVEALHDCVRTQCPEMLIVNPTFGDYFDVAKFREEISGKRIRLIALVTSFVDASLLGKYDESISIFDDLETLSKKIAGLLNVVSEEEVIEDAIAYVESFHYIDDRRYAMRFAEIYKDSRSIQRIRQDLQKRHVDDLLIEEALENIDWDDSMALRKEIRKLTKGQQDFFDRMSYQEKQKYIARLYRKGFRTDSIFRELESYRNGNT